MLINANSDDDLFSCQPELLALFETLVDVIFCAKGRDGIYLAANSAFVRRTGQRSMGEVIGSSATDHFLPELAERYEEQDAHVFRTGAPLYDELELIRRTDQRLGWYLTTKLPVRDGQTVVGLVSVSRDLVAPPDADVGLENLRDVVHHIQVNHPDPIRVADLAAVAGCSEAQLERRMKRVFGVTATQHILRVRVEAATRLLSDGDLPLAQVATACGFYDQPDFTRRFARLTGTTPAQFRAHASGPTDPPS